MLSSLLVLLCLLLVSSFAQTPSYLAEIKVDHPSFVQLFPPRPNDADALWVTSFSGFKAGQVYYAPEIASSLAAGKKVQFQNVDGDFLWPNLISEVPQGTIIGVNNVVAIVPDGFLVPGKETGGLYVLLRDDVAGGFTIRKNVSLVAKQSGWFYHMVVWRDLNFDGRLDIITARAKSEFGIFKGELLWLEQPPSNPLGKPWVEHVLAPGPDVIFAVNDFTPNDGLFELYAAEFFSNQLTVFEITEGSSVAVKTHQIIDKMEGPYDVHLLDLNMDGALNLLVSNHAGGAGGNVTAYEIPDVIVWAGGYKKHTLATGFKVTEGGQHQAAPGFLTPFYVNANQVNKVAPSIFVAGDGSQSAYIMTPTGNLLYDTSLVVDVGGVVGIIASDNIGANGKDEFFVPDYDDNRILAYTFK